MRHTSERDLPTIWGRAETGLLRRRLRCAPDAYNARGDHAGDERGGGGAEIDRTVAIEVRGGAGREKQREEGRVQDDAPRGQVRMSRAQ